MYFLIYCFSESKYWYMDTACLLGWVEVGGAAESFLVFTSLSVNPPPFTPPAVPASQPLEEPMFQD